MKLTLTSLALLLVLACDSTSVAGVELPAAPLRELVPGLRIESRSYPEHAATEWQFHRADLGESLVQAFRRPEAANETLTVKLRGLDPQQRYEMENLDGGKEVRTGEELLRGLDITLREKPAAAVLVLKALK